MSLMQIVIGGLTYKAKETLAVSTASVGFTSATIGRNDQALITCEGATVRYWLNGDDPTSTVGHILEEGAAELAERLAERYWDLDDPDKRATVATWRRASAVLRLLELIPTAVRSYVA